MMFKAKKKEAIAKTIISPGRGVVRINARHLNLVEPPEVQTFIREPLLLAGEAAHAFDFDVRVQGSGPMSQAVAVRATLAKALAEHLGDDLRKKYLQYDRMLLVDDPRRTEPKKPLGPKARRKKQHSKR